jgi:hypothetical protein
MTEETKKETLGGLASLVQDGPYTSVFSDQMFLDAAAVIAMRQQIDKLMPRDEGYARDWRIPDAIKVLEILNTFLEQTMSKKMINEQGQVDAWVKHPAAIMTDHLVMALKDLFDGVPNNNLEVGSIYRGNRQKTTDVENICHGLFLVSMLREGGRFTAKEARARAAKILKKEGMTVRDKEMTEDRLLEWAKDYTFQGKKIKGK